MSVVVPKNVEIVQLITGYGGQTPFDHQILVTDMGEFISANYAHLSSWDASTRTLTSSSAWGSISFTVIYYGYQS